MGILGPPNTAKQGKAQNDKSTLFYPPTAEPMDHVVAALAGVEDPLFHPDAAAQPMHAGAEQVAPVW